MTQATQRESSTEVVELARDKLIGGVCVRTRCYAVPGLRAPRYEVVLEGAGEVAVLDLGKLDGASAVIDGAVMLFVAAARARGSCARPVAWR